MSGQQTPTDQTESTEIDTDLTLTADLETDFDSLNLYDQERKLQEERAIIQSGDDDELERFRREWRAEVTHRRKGDTGGVRSNGETASQAQNRTEDHPTSRLQERSPGTMAGVFEPISTSPTRHGQSSKPTQTQSGGIIARDCSRSRSRSPTNVKQPSGLPSTTRSHEAGPSKSTPQTQASAVQLYAQAVENEQAGQLNDALLLYRRAFKIDGTSEIGTCTVDTTDSREQIMWIGYTRDRYPNTYRPRWRKRQPQHLPI